MVFKAITTVNTFVSACSYEFGTYLTEIGSGCLFRCVLFISAS